MPGSTYNHSIHSELSLCDGCLARLSGVIKSVPVQKCFICRGMMNTIKEMSDIIIRRTELYEFETFTIGATLKPSILDRDDYIRSKLRARGTSSIKTALTGQLIDIISKHTKKRLDRTNPDITVLMDTRFGSCEIRSRQMLVQAQYTKRCRTIPQRDVLCGQCNGQGCADCNFTRYKTESIQGIFQKHLSDITGGTSFCFIWCGGEDITSRVLGDGRRFYVRIKNPKRRQIPDRLDVGQLQFHSIQTIPSMPARMPTMRSQIRMIISFQNNMPDNLKPLHHMDRIVRVSDQAGKVSIKKIHAIHYKRLSDTSLQVIIDVEGGLSVKRFVSGDDVHPSISSTLQTECKCRWFDFINITHQ